MIISFLTLNNFYLSAQDKEEPIISLYKGSELKFDDNLGFETFYYLTSEKSHAFVDGQVNRKFCAAPENVSAYEVIKNYEQAITSKGGTIIHLSRDAYRYTDEKTGEKVWFMSELFTNKRLKPMDRGWAYAQLPKEAQDYIVGKISTPEHDLYISVAAAVIEDATYYTIVTVKTEPMNMDNVTLNILNEGIGNKGKVAIYNIYFDTGKSEVKSESKAALATIADYLKNNSDKKFLIVGHTDNTGDFESNVQLSTARANAVIEKLVADFGIDASQLTPYGVASSCPEMSNDSDAGKARNRRVELVEL